MPGGRHDVHLRRGLGDFDLDFEVVDLALAQALAEGLAGAVVFAAFGLAGGAARGRHQGVEDAVFGGVFSLGAHAAHFQFARLLDRVFGQIADDGVDVAAHIAHFGELGGFDLDERRVGQLGQAAGDLGFTHAGGADHEDVLGVDLVAQGLGDLLAAPAVAQGDRHGALGAVLADDVFVEFGDDLSGRHVGCGHEGESLES